MARPQKTGLDYFPHDTDAVNDEKIEAMRAEYGNDGYAFFFICCERIFRAENGEINLGNTAMKKALISKIGIDAPLFDRMLTTAFDIELFSKADFDTRNVLTSNGVKRRYEAVSRLRERWRKNKQVIREENPVENPEVTPESKVKKSKENKIIYGSFKNVKLTEVEYGKLITEYGEAKANDMIEYLSSYRAEKGYKNKSDYLSLRRWVSDAVEKEKPRQEEKIKW